MNPFSLTHPIIVALGCNLGERRLTFERACRLLEKNGVKILRVSRLYWTRPWGVPDQPDFLNAALWIWTPLSPCKLLERMHVIEVALGRQRTRRWGARRLDLDLILYGSARMHAPFLELPHPGLARRDFVLAPLIDLGVPPPREIAPRGWRALLRQIPAVERTIVSSADWK